MKPPAFKLQEVILIAMGCMLAGISYGYFLRAMEPPPVCHESAP